MISDLMGTKKWIHPSWMISTVTSPARVGMMSLLFIHAQVKNQLFVDTFHDNIAINKRCITSFTRYSEDKCFHKAT